MQIFYTFLERSFKSRGTECHISPRGCEISHWPRLCGSLSVAHHRLSGTHVHRYRWSFGCMNLIGRLDLEGRGTSDPNPANILVPLLHALSKPEKCRTSLFCCHLGKFFCADQSGRFTVSRADFRHLTTSLSRLTKF